MKPTLEDIRPLCKEIADFCDEAKERHEDTPFEVVVIVVAKRSAHPTAHMCVVATTMENEEHVLQALTHAKADLEADRVQARGIIQTTTPEEKQSEGHEDCRRAALGDTDGPIQGDVDAGPRQ